MSVDSDLLKTLMNINGNSSLKYTLYLNDQSYSLDDVVIENSPTPVNAPTTRGGVYFSDTFAYKVKGIVHDLSVIPLLSKTMLGPNTDFGEIKIKTDVDLNGQKKNLTLYTNLTNSIQHPDQIELNMILIKLESD
ncbi:hypothetical protein NsoK4_03420 [Nitrosopumilus sp. K4]|uniref:hypothetical protein n=1 Tax=Nitrosopumilus sp. K4 TaxID=2795383 RepID=UPI001BAA8879|nr:hypothetical protein [Nitrosopumilus sp. K4]QUC65308.1 hypothetical protein NsoK4_03420 [Nitrosopumilus sp. K4]